jgi:hypothetical protein
VEEDPFTYRIPSTKNKSNSKAISREKSKVCMTRNNRHYSVLHRARCGLLFGRIWI